MIPLSGAHCIEDPEMNKFQVLTFNYNFSSENDWKRTKLILALGADLTKKGYWRQQRRSLILGEKEEINGSPYNDWRGGSALTFAQELYIVNKGDINKDKNLARLVELLQEEVSFTF